MFHSLLYENVTSNLERTLILTSKIGSEQLAKCPDCGKGISKLKIPKMTRSTLKFVPSASSVN
jgi:hypothetical protein